MTLPPSVAGGKKKIMLYLVRLSSGHWIGGSLEISLQNFIQWLPLPMAGNGHTHTQGHKCTLVCVCMLRPLLTSSCFSPRALQRWLFPEKGWLDLLCGCLKQRLLTPVTPIPFHGALLLPASSFPSLPPGLVQTWHPICYLHREVRARLAPALFSAWVTWLWLACFSLCSLKASVGVREGAGTRQWPLTIRNSWKRRFSGVLPRCQSCLGKAVWEDFDGELGVHHRLQDRWTALPVK